MTDWPVYDAEIEFRKLGATTRLIGGVNWYCRMNGINTMDEFLANNEKSPMSRQKNVGRKTFLEAGQLLADAGRIDEDYRQKYFIPRARPVSREDRLATVQSRLDRANREIERLRRRNKQLEDMYTAICVRAIDAECKLNSLIETRGLRPGN